MNNSSFFFKISKYQQFKSFKNYIDNNLIFWVMIRVSTPTIFCFCFLNHEEQSTFWRCTTSILQFSSKMTKGASLVVQWLRIRLPMQGTRVRALVWEDPTCHRSTKPMHHNYWACALQPTSHNYWAHVPQLLKPACLEPVLRNKMKPPQWEAHAPQWRVAPARHK